MSETKIQKILNENRSKDPVKDDDVIYGVTDMRSRTFSQRVNDFFVDRTKITLKDKSYFFHMLAVMVDAGIPVVKAVKTLSARAENGRFRRVLNTIAYNMEHGLGLSEAMSRFADVFDDAELGIVKSGEATGRLHLMLFKLSAQLEKKHDLQSKLFGAAFYPLVVLAVLIVVMVIMLVWVFPRLLGLLEQSGISADSLPLPTRILMTIQSAFAGYWWLILLVIFGCYGIFKFYVASEYGRARWDNFKLGVPAIGALMRKVYVLRFVSNMGLLIESGLPVISALDITRQSLGNQMYKLLVLEVIEKVKDGARISDSLLTSTFFFPAEVVQMMAVGESSASLGKISEKIADQYQREIDNSLRKASSVFQPIMILIVGLLVALLALAIMSPIFNLSQNAGF